MAPEDKFLIVASDGVWEFIESIDVVKIVSPFYESNNVEGACDYLLGLALKRWQEVINIFFIDKILNHLYRKKKLWWMILH